MRARSCYRPRSKGYKVAAVRPFPSIVLPCAPLPVSFSCCLPPSLRSPRRQTASLRFARGWRAAFIRRAARLLRHAGRTPERKGLFVLKGAVLRGSGCPLKPAALFVPSGAPCFGGCRCGLCAASLRRGEFRRLRTAGKGASPLCTPRHSALARGCQILWRPQGVSVSRVTSSRG